MKIHELKTHPEYFHAISLGLKTFEVRFNDRNFKVGDYLKLREYNPILKVYTGRYAECKITYILDNEEYVKEKYVIMSIAALKFNTNIDEYNHYKGIYP